MVRVRGQYRNGRIELEQPLNLPDGSDVEVAILPAEEPADDDWRDLGMNRLEEERNNDQDAVYDDWRRLCSVRQP